MQTETSPIASESVVIVTKASVAWYGCVRVVGAMSFNGILQPSKMSNEWQASLQAT